METFAAGDRPFLVFENSDFFALYKPCGMHSARLAGERGGAAHGTAPESLLDWIDAFVPRFATSSMPGGEYGMLSRLDQATSGIILFAKNSGLFALLRSREAAPAHQDAILEKHYRLVASPKGDGLPGSRPRLMPVPEGLPFRISSRFRSYGKKGAKVACIAPDQEFSVKKPISPDVYWTRFEECTLPFCLQQAGRISDGEGSFPADVRFLQATIISGFRHQIRAHCAWLGFPILGDPVYGGMPASRLFLEASALDMRLPGRPALHIDLYGKEPSSP